MSGESDLDTGGQERDEPERRAVGPSVADSSQICLTHQYQASCKAPQLSSGGSQPDLNSGPKKATPDHGSMWEEVVSGPECPLLTVKLGHPDASSQSLQCLVTASLLLGPHVSTEDTKSVESAITLTDEVQQGPMYLIPDMPGSEGWVGICDDDDAQTDECPVCSESYGHVGTHRAALLNCDHTLCESCLSRMLWRSADPSRIQCPLCRQRTPLLHWEIRRMQEETTSYGPVAVTTEPSETFHDSSPPMSLLPSSLSFCVALEQRLRARAESEVVCGCCWRPRWLSQALRRSQRCRCCYMTLLLALGAAELSLLLLVFLPVIMLVLLFTFVGR